MPGATLQQPVMKGGITQLLHLLFDARRRVRKPRSAGSAAACADFPEAVEGVHQGGTGVSNRYHVSADTVGAGWRRDFTKPLSISSLSSMDGHVERKHTVKHFNSDNSH